MKIKFQSSESFYKFLQKIYGIFETAFLAAIKVYLNTQLGQGSLKKIVNWLADNLYEQTMKPILEILLVRVGYKYDVREGQVFIERLKKAEEEGNAEDYNSTVDDILN